MTTLYDKLIKEIDKESYAETNLNVRCWLHQLCRLIETEYLQKKRYRPKMQEIEEPEDITKENCECLSYSTELRTHCEYLIGPYCCQCGRKL